MNGDIKAKWLQALRSGEYKQGHGRLRILPNLYCCLGVLCEVMGVKADGVLYDGCTSYISPRTQNVAGLRAKDQSRLSSMNDRGDTFPEIADWIETNL
jgi:hypothetical protein